MMKTILILMASLMLASCSLFQETPEHVVAGQRTVYQGLLIAEENDEKIINRYLQDTKAAVTYHIHFVFEPKIDAIRQEADLSREDKSLMIAELERERQAQIDAAFADIEAIAEDMRATVMKNHAANKKLVESIYAYMTTSPLSTDIIPFLIEELNRLRN